MATAKAERFYVCLSILYEGILSGNVGGFVVCCSNLKTVLQWASQVIAPLIGSLKTCERLRVGNVSCGRGRRLPLCRCARFAVGGYAGLEPCQRGLRGLEPSNSIFLDGHFTFNLSLRLGRTPSPPTPFSAQSAESLQGRGGAKYR